MVFRELTKPEERAKDCEGCDGNADYETSDGFFCAHCVAEGERAVGELGITDAYGFPLEGDGFGSGV